MAPRVGHVFRTLEDRLHDKILPEPNTGCWLWTGSDNGVGYGTMTMGKSTRAYAHRVSYEFFVGPVPAGMQLDHRCRVRCCVNPQHLEPVTNAENARRGNCGHHMKDGNAPRGSSHAGTRLDEATVTEMRRLHREGTTQSEIAREFNISKPTVSLIMRRKTWNHIS